LSNQIGKFGERIASEFLEKQGCIVLQKNYHSRYGEIDIIATDEEYIMFVEVKTRNKNCFACPSEYVNRKKRIKIIKTALIYLSETSTSLQPRFDIIEIKQHKKNKLLIRHIKNAFGE
jgi:putative endonuclease